ncbi:hypothetical protein [Chitiniphilus shinanonensis]|uniref:hypothetical protein n=1 Tax=Chitiniphilus shinanonensis TaxID=553088 RepID=UPI00333F7A97
MKAMQSQRTEDLRRAARILASADSACDPHSAIYSAFKGALEAFAPALPPQQHDEMTRKLSALIDEFMARPEQ